MKTFRNSVILPTLFVFSVMALWLPAANATILSTSTAQATALDVQNADPVQAFISREVVREKLVQFGVRPEQATARVNALTPAERQQLEKKIAELPAGAGAVEVIGIVFIVLLILELLGVTDVFKRI